MMKNGIVWFYSVVVSPGDAGGMANSVNNMKRAPMGAVWP